MPVTPTYPGVYIEEIPIGVRTITGVATSITAFVGYTARGLIDKAVRLLSFGDYERVFGGLHRDSEIAFAVQQFFLNGGTDAYVVRVATGALRASVTLKYGAGAGNDALVVNAANEGAWGNYVRLDVDYQTSNPDSTFNLIVTRFDLQNGKHIPMENEQYRNLSMNSRSATYAPNAVSGSKLIELTRPPDLTFAAADRGYSLSGKLSPFPSLSAQETTITGVLDGTDPFTLVLTGALPGDIAALVTSVNNAITAAGLVTRLQAVRANALGADDPATGNYLKLKSLLVGGNTNTNPEHSSVQVVRASANDASAKLKLGLGQGGREKEGASYRRPLPTGTFSKDLTDMWDINISGAITVVVNDNSSGAPVAIFPATAVGPFPPTAVGPALRDKLQELIRGINHVAAQQATVQLSGTFLRVVPSASTPNASIVLTGTGATASGLDGAGSFVNVQQYSLGTGISFGAQTGSSAGGDGTPPTNASSIIGNYAAKTGLYALRDVDLFNLLVIPRTSQLSDAEAKSILAKAIAFCEERRAFYIVDPDPTRMLNNIGDWATSVGTSKNAAVFFPRLKIANPIDGFRLTDMPASGTLAGIFARTDSERGVWKAPAGIDAVLKGVQGLTLMLTDQENGTLNPLGVNCLRTFPVYGTVAWGARTMQGDDRLASEWKYIPVRRLALFIEESLYRGTKWVVFEPNDEPLWAQIRLNVGAFMHDLFRKGAFQGKTPREAYFVKCDKETTTQNDINLGIVNILVGFAPLKPAEFVIIKIQQMAGQIQT
jgi:phage tail sheath protein FI